MSNTVQQHVQHIVLDAVEWYFTYELKRTFVTDSMRRVARLELDDLAATLTVVTSSESLNR